MSIRTWLAAGAALVGLAASGPAWADVDYRFFASSYVDQNGASLGRIPAPFDLIVSNAAVASGQLSASVTYGGASCGAGSPPCFGSNPGYYEIRSFADLGIFGGTLTNQPGAGGGYSLSLSLQFAADGTLSGSIRDLGMNTDIVISGANGVFSGDYVPDLAPCYADLSGIPTTPPYNNRCVITGRFVQVPEPASLAMLGMGLLGVAGAVRRRRG